MKKLIIRCALWLKKQGIGPDDIVVHCSDNHLNSAIPFYATIFMGAVINPWYYKVDTSKLKVIFMSKHDCN